ncbi:MAG: GC-type dockerin domain-anchored protein [bacterium]
MHSTRLTPWALLAAATAMAPLAAFAQTANPEAEPNETRSTATAAASGGPGMASGDTITGTTTGSSTTLAGPTSADIFRVKTAAAPLRIYRHRLSLLSSTVGHTATIRGLAQTTSSSTTTGVIGTLDSTAQTSSTTFPGAATGTRTNQWYGFGRQEEIYYRVAGLGTTTAAYTATLDTQVVTPTVVATALPAGPITIDRAGHTNDTDFWIYDSNFNAIPDFGNDDPDTLTRTFAPGTYYIAWANFNVANNQPSASGDTFRTATVLDFPNAVLNSSTTSFSLLDIRLTGGSVSTTVALTKTQFEIQWLQFTVAELTTSPAGVITASPSRFLQGLGGNTLVTVNVTPGNAPVSSGLAVVADLSSIGGSATQALFDDGTNGDVTAGDNIFSFAASVPSSTALGSYAVPFTVTDAQARSGNGTTSLTVLPVFPLGSLTATNTPLVVDTNLAAAEVKWYSFTTTQDASPTVFFDFHTGGSLLAPSNDTESGLFNLATGARVAATDDAGGLRSLLSFGQTDPSRSYTDPTNAAIGQTSPTLPAGNYAIALSGFNADFANGFVANSTSANSGPVRLTLATNGLPPSLACNVADIVAIGGQPPADGILTGDDFNAFIGAFANGDLLADIVAIGGTPPGDGLITGDDFNAFIAAFATGCP